MARMTHHDADYDPRWDDDDENYTAAEYGDDGGAESPRTRLARHGPEHGADDTNRHDDVPEVFRAADYYDPQWDEHSDDDRPDLHSFDDEDPAVFHIETLRQASAAPTVLPSSSSRVEGVREATPDWDPMYDDWRSDDGGGNSTSPHADVTVKSPRSRLHGADDTNRHDDVPELWATINETQCAVSEAFVAS